jgi:Transglycosylase SLT domain
MCFLLATHYHPARANWIIANWIMMAVNGRISDAMGASLRVATAAPTGGRASGMRRAFLVVTVLLMMHMAREPEPILLPDPAQDLWPEPRLRLPAVDLTLVEGTVMEGWLSAPTVVTAEEVRTDRFLWRKMFFRNWDQLPTPLRNEGLQAMYPRYRRVLRGPERWRTMNADDWDRVPQPMRAMAVLGMIDCWERLYLPGDPYGLGARSVADRMQAIAMSESWFVHRAVSENTEGGEDIGIGQASAPTRSRIRVLYVRSLADFGLADDDYFDPWKATRALVFWFKLLLEEAEGDLDLATRAYNVGMARALQGSGALYLAAVERREREYILGPSRSPTWIWLRARSPAPCPGAQRRDPFVPMP